MLKYLIIASVFWFNPLVSNVDILPDFVGYLLVLKAFYKASYSYECASELCQSAKKMCIVSGVKIFTIFMVSSLDITMSLLFSFCFGAIELIFGIPFFIKLFETIIYVVPAENGYAHAREHKIRHSTIIAFVARLVLAMLPDLTALSLDGAFSYDVDMSYLRFRPLFIVFSVTISLVIGIIWLAKIIKFFRKTVNSEVVEKCQADFLNRVGNNKALLSAKNSIRAVIATGVGALFIFDFTWEYTSVDILQDFVVTAIAIGALLFLAFKKIYKLDLMFFGLLGIFGAQIGADVFEMVSNVTYFEKYNLQSVFKSSEAERQYAIVSLSAVLSVVSLIGATCVILVILRKNARNNILSNQKLFSEIDIDYYVKEFDKRTKKHIVMVSFISVVYGLVYSLSVIFKPYAEWMTLLNLVFEIIYIISFVAASLYVHDEVYKRIVTFA